jgi:hypothetical protein
MIKNVFEDNGKAIYDVKNNSLFSYSFSSDAHIIDEDMENFNYASGEQSLMLDEFLKIRNFGESRSMSLSLLLKLDRSRTVLYNGNEIIMNSYKCSSCNATYIMEKMEHLFCPHCGKHYNDQLDVSI